MQLLDASLVPRTPLDKVQWSVESSESDKPARSRTPEPQAHGLSYADSHS